MSQSVKVYEGAYLSTDKKTAISGLEELYSYLMTKFLKEYNVGTSLTQLYKDVTAFLKEEAGSDKKPESFENYSDLQYDSVSNAFQLKYATLRVSYGYATVRSDKVIIVSEKNTYPYESDNRTYVLKMPAGEFQNVKNFFFSKVLIPETANLGSYVARVTWISQTLRKGSGDSLAFVKFVSPKNLEAYKKKADALIKVARYLQKVLPDAIQTSERAYLNYFLYSGYDEDFLKSNFDIGSIRRGDYDPNDATSNRYLQILKGLGYGYTSDSPRIGNLKTSEVLGKDYQGYANLCKQAGIKPSERIEFRTKKVNMYKGEAVEIDEYIW